MTMGGISTNRQRAEYFGIRVNVAAIGTSSDITVGDGYTWAYATITPR
jgi:hypothetical protein